MYEIYEKNANVMRIIYKSLHLVHTLQFDPLFGLRNT